LALLDAAISWSARSCRTRGWRVDGAVSSEVSGRPRPRRAGRRPSSRPRLGARAPSSPASARKMAASLALGPRAPPLLAPARAVDRRLLLTFGLQDGRLLVLLGLFLLGHGLITLVGGVMSRSRYGSAHAPLHRGIGHVSCMRLLIVSRSESAWSSESSRTRPATPCGTADRPPGGSR